MIQWFVIYLVVINGVGFLVMGIDNRKAIKGKWRIPEKHLFFYALIGGSLGSTFGMILFRHKVKRLKFTLGFPLLIILHIALINFVLQSY
ncbi:DUF1294 domain-containing protein [Salinibacillus xinjiangensis]|uniref:DUF1294 domain-containing protein n=1 Tax=Salinibacillus xinjiangensis TaxID=1229268 RepID=A0A6G1X9J9_9BACI|nr:DUF1294 domain-containing protein [Salinibacillus xinjiangensis]